MPIVGDGIRSLMNNKVLNYFDFREILTNFVSVHIIAFQIWK